MDGTFLKPAAAAGEVTATELQQSIFNAPPSAAQANLPAPVHLPAPVTAASLKPPTGDVSMDDAKSPATSAAGQKRRRDDDDDDEEEEMDEDSEGDAAMEEDSDDD